MLLWKLVNEHNTKYLCSVYGILSSNKYCINLKACDILYLIKGDIIRSMSDIAATGATPFLSPMLEDDPAATSDHDRLCRSNSIQYSASRLLSQHQKISQL